MRHKFTHMSYVYVYYYRKKTTRIYYIEKKFIRSNDIFMYVRSYDISRIKKFSVLLFNQSNLYYVRNSHSFAFTYVIFSSFFLPHQTELLSYFSSPIILILIFPLRSLLFRNLRLDLIGSGAISKEEKMRPVFYT